MENPKVSVIIPVYNGSNYMREAIDSALAQTYDNFEVLVVNDGSNDGGKTEETALSYGSRIRYFAKENGGVATALNLGIEKMEGEYFSWLSHDDLYAPNKLAAQIQALRSCGCWRRIVYSDYDILDMASMSKETTHFQDQYRQKLSDSVFPVLYGLIHGCSLLIHKSHFERVGRFDETLITSQDYDMWFRMFRGEKTIFVPQRLICSRRHPEQGTNTIACYQQESANFFMNTVMSLSAGELLPVFGHPALVYWQVAWTLAGYGNKEACRKLTEWYRAFPVPDNAKQRMKAFQAWTANMYQPGKQVCVFGCGDFGRRCRFLLSAAGIAVDFVSDNNPALWGKLVDGIPCISPAQLQERSQDTLVLVALSRPEPVLEQLQCPHIITKQMIDRALLDVLLWDDSGDRGGN